MSIIICANALNNRGRGSRSKRNAYLLHALLELEQQVLRPAERDFAAKLAN